MLVPFERRLLRGPPMSDSSATDESYPAIIIGAGQAGVALSYGLQQLGVGHLVLEQDRPFSDWYRCRWDSFAMNTPNWMNVLPGESEPFAPGAPRGSYGKRSDALKYFESYLHHVRPPVRIETVESVGENRDGSWQVVTDNATYRSENLAICTGHASRNTIPDIASGIPRVVQMHSSEYMRPAQIKTANVLIVGSGSSGVQICEELAQSGRFQNVYLAGSGNFTLPWSVLGIPTYLLMRWLGVFKITRQTWLGRRMFRRLRSKGDPATPPSPRQLAKQHGVRRTGRVEAVGDNEIRCDDGKGIALDDLTIVWCTGFAAAYDFLDVYVREAVLDDCGYPKQVRGVSTNMRGLFFVGLRFQHTFISQDIGGVGQDAMYVAERIAARQSAPSPNQRKSVNGVLN